MLPKHFSIISKWAWGLSEILANQSGQVCPSGATSPQLTQPSVIRHLWLSSCLFSHHLFHSTANTMTYYVFQLDSPRCLRSNSLTACELQSPLPIFHHDSWRITSKCLAVCQMQVEGTWREKRLLWEILILIFQLFASVNNIHHDKKQNICSFWIHTEGVVKRT